MPLLLRSIGKPSTPRGRVAIPITQPINHRKITPEADHDYSTRNGKGNIDDPDL
jgi:hypothetical protein